MASSCQPLLPSLRNTSPGQKLKQGTATNLCGWEAAEGKENHRHPPSPRLPSGFPPPPQLPANWQLQGLVFVVLGNPTSLLCPVRGAGWVPWEPKHLHIFTQRRWNPLTTTTTTTGSSYLFQPAEQTWFVSSLPTIFVFAFPGSVNH